MGKADARESQETCRADEDGHLAMMFGLEKYTNLAIGIVIAVLIASVGTYIAVITHQRNAAVRELADIKAQSEIVRAKKEAEVKEVEAKQTKITTDTALGFNDALTRQKAYYESKLDRNRVIPHSVQQQSSGGSNAMPSAPEGASGANEGAAHVTLDRPGEQAAEVTEEECAETTLQVLWLQDWARKQGLFK